LAFLVSFAYYDDLTRTIIDATYDMIDWLVDSGAFSNYSARVKSVASGVIAERSVKLADYIKECKEFFDGRVWQYIMLDEIRDPKGTKKNLAMMRKAGLSPMPVFVEMMKEKDLDNLIEMTPWICVAGAVGGTAKYLSKRFRKVYHLSHERAKIHALGLGHRTELVLRSPIRSSDSTTWANGQRYGEIRTYDPMEKHWYSHRQLFIADNLDNGTLTLKDKKVLARMYGYGITPDMIHSRKKEFSVSYYSISSLVSLWESLNYFIDCDKYGKTYVFAISGCDALAAFIGCLLSNHTNGSFDYLTARDAALEASEDLKAKRYNVFVDKLRRGLGDVPVPRPEHRL